jgi:hypothetical protein
MHYSHNQQIQPMGLELMVKKYQTTTMIITNELEDMILCVGDHEDVLV